MGLATLARRTRRWFTEREDLEGSCQIIALEVFVGT